MKSLIKLAVATLLTIAAAPAFADEQDTLAERNVYLAARQKQQIAERHMQRERHDVSGTDANASEPAPAPNDFSILSQH